MGAAIQVRVRIDANLPWRYTIGRGGNYVAVCDPLKLTLQAESWDELMEDTSDVLNSIFHDLLRANELDRFLRDHGWTMLGRVPDRPENVRFEVPFCFTPEMASTNGPQRHVHQ